MRMSTNAPTNWLTAKVRDDVAADYRSAMRKVGNAKDLIEGALPTVPMGFTDPVVNTACRLSGELTDLYCAINAAIDEINKAAPE